MVHRITFSKQVDILISKDQALQMYIHHLSVLVLNITTLLLICVHVYISITHCVVGCAFNSVVYI